MSGCAHLIHLDRAQNNFNRGAELENQLRFNPSSDVSALPSAYYTLAYAELEKALNNKKGLSSDNVLASAYTIKALCEWKFKQYDAAEKSADAALEELKKMRRRNIMLPRDKALMEALPSLMKIDKVKDTLYAFHSPVPPFEAGKDHYLQFIFDPDSTKMASLEAAIHEIGEVEDRTAANEELSAYFVMSQLAALKTWSDALDNLLSCIREDPSFKGDENKAARRKARKWQEEQGDGFLEVKEKELLEKLRNLIPGERGKRLAEYWDLLIGG